MLYASSYDQVHNAVSNVILLLYALLLAVGEESPLLPQPKLSQRLGSTSATLLVCEFKENDLNNFCLHENSLYITCNDSVHFSISTSGKHLSNMVMVPSLYCAITLGTSFCELFGSSVRMSHSNPVSQKYERFYRIVVDVVSFLKVTQITEHKAKT